ncbi:MAG: ABC transporter ATP-binding protein [Acidimicrobiales bacterium]
MTGRRRIELLGKYVGAQRIHLGLLVLAAFVPALLTTLEPLAIKLLIDNALGGETLSGFPARVVNALGLSSEPRSLVLAAALFALATTIGSYLSSAGIGMYWEWVGVRMVRNVARDVFDALQHLPPSFHARTASGDALSRVISDASSVYTAVSVLLVSPAMHLITIVTVGWAAWLLDPGLMIIILCFAAVTASGSRWLSNRLKRVAARARRQQVAVVSFVTQVISSLALVQAYTAERQNLLTFRSLNQRSLMGSRRVTLFESSANAISAVVGAVAVAAVLVLGGRSVVDNRLSVGDVVVFIAYTRVLDANFRALLSLGRQLRLAEVGLERIDEIITCDERLSDPADPIPLVSGHRGASVRFEDVTFGYDPGSPILENVSIEIRPGETVAIVGESGAGKSTLVGLLSRLYDPDSGRVMVDGVDLRDAAIADVRRSVSVLRQEPLLLPVPVYSNIALGRPGSSGGEIKQAARLALAHDFITQLPERYHTVLGSTGHSLSGGERQRLAIARAFLKDSPVLVLDEPTSALDADSESSVVDSFKRISEGRTVLIIAHRLATARGADRILVLEHGRLTQVGSHDELVSADGLYARFHDLQSTDGALELEVQAR